MTNCLYCKTPLDGEGPKVCLGCPVENIDWCGCTDEEPCAFHHDRAVEEAYQPNPAKWKQVPR